MGASIGQVSQDDCREPSHPDFSEVGAPRPAARSLLRVAPALVLFAIVIADAMRVADIDLWGHIRFGQAILAIGQPPGHDHYAYSAPGLPWRNHEWLSDVLFAFVYDSFGIRGLKLLKFACTSGTLLLLADALGETGAALSVQFAVLIVSAVALVPQMQFRPQLFDYLFLAALLAMLARESYQRRSAPLWLAVPMLALWANLHGGFFVGLVVLGTYTLVSGLRRLRNRQNIRPSVRIGVITALSAVATLCNPWGIGEWQIVLHTLQNPYTMRRVSEFQPLLERLLAFHRSGLPIFPFVAALVMFAALAVTVAVAPLGEDWELLLVAAIMIGSAFDAIRNTALAVLSTAPTLARHASLALVSRREKSTTACAKPLMLTTVVVQVAVAVTGIALAAATGLFSPSLSASEPCPVGAVNFMASHDLHGDILNSHRWGDYLIWHTPHSKVFIDSRFEMVYPLRIQRDYLTFASGSMPGAARVLAKYPNDFVLMPTDSPAYAMMMKQTLWRLIYRDPVAALFARANSRAAHIPGVPLIQKTAPPSFFP